MKNVMIDIDDKGYIRKVRTEDVGRMAEIIVFNNRKYYYPIFQDMNYSFSEFNVIDVARSFLEDKEFMENTYVFEDQVIKGFICVVNQEIKKLYIDYFFQKEGIGSRLLVYAIEELQASHLWALEKNHYALRFYEKHGFLPDGEKCYEEGSTEFLVHLCRE